MMIPGRSEFGHVVGSFCGFGCGVYYILQGMNCIVWAGGLVVQLYPSGGFKVSISSGVLYPSGGKLSCGYIILCIYGCHLIRHYLTLRYNDGRLSHRARELVLKVNRKALLSIG